MSIVKELIKHGADVITVDVNGRSPLHVAARGRHGAVLAELVMRGARVSGLDTDGKRALDLVTEWACKTLAQHAQNSNAQESKPGAVEDTAFTTQIRDNIEALMDPLLLGPEGRAKGWTALHAAAHTGEARAVAVILGLESKFTKIGDCNIHLAVEDRITNKRDNFGDTALHIAARAGNLHIVELLIQSEHQCDLHIRNLSRENAVMLATKHHHLLVVDALQEAMKSESARDRC